VRRMEEGREEPWDTQHATHVSSQGLGATAEHVSTSQLSTFWLDVHCVTLHYIALRCVASAEDKFHTRDFIEGFGCCPPWREWLRTHFERVGYSIPKTDFDLSQQSGHSSISSHFFTTVIKMDIFGHFYPFLYTFFSSSKSCAWHVRHDSQAQMSGRCLPSRSSAMNTCLSRSPFGASGYQGIVQIVLALSPFFLALLSIPRKSFPPHYNMHKPPSTSHKRPVDARAGQQSSKPRDSHPPHSHVEGPGLEDLLLIQA